jgi:hypothetical protein
MGTWKITVEGHGIHHNNRADDANEMARGFGNALLRNGHGLKEVQFQLTNSDGTPCAPVETIALDAQPSTEAPEHIMQFFAFAHLPPHLQKASAPFAELAKVVVETTPRNPERTVALRKLLEAKDAAVRALLAK